MSALDTLDVGQANELKLAFRKHGWTNEDVKWLSEGDVLADVLRVRRGEAEIREVEYVACDVDPSLPQGWEVAEDRSGRRIARAVYVTSSSGVHVVPWPG